MYISEITVQNYKSFLEPTALKLGPGFNVIVGQNNSGKTALLEATSLAFGHSPHRSAKTVPNRNHPLTSSSRVTATIAFGHEELKAIMADRMLDGWVPIDDKADPVVERQAFLKWVRSPAVRSFTENGNNVAYGDLVGFHEFGNSNSPCARYVYDPAGDKVKLTDQRGTPRSNQTLGASLFQHARSQFYMFRAERMHAETHLIQKDRVLKPDTSNLASVLHAFLSSADKTRVLELDMFLHEVFPDIRQITAPAVDDDNAQVMVWPEGVAQDREDLAFTLGNVGSGVAQVLAMLYVAMTAEYPKVFIIDEPQTFLHPGAVRKLFGVLERFPRHQYIVSTHSPTLIAAVEPSTTLLVTKHGFESAITSISRDDTRKTTLVLAELGVRLSDVFGADSILWVEGATEELCFPVILKRLKGHPLTGTSIIGVRQTGDLEGRHKRTVFEIYERMSASTNLLPPAIGFLFDRERRTEQDIEDMVRAGKGKVHFLKPRMFENYLLVPEAIAAVANTIEGFSSEPITAKAVNEWLTQNAATKKNDWLITEDGAGLLARLFSQLSETRVSYDKVAHGSALTEWIIDNKPDRLEELASLIDDVLATGKEGP